jgi:isocitrate dehydrogenase
MMLVHLGMSQKSRDDSGMLYLQPSKICIHTGDIANETTTKKAGTQEFADAIIERLGQKANETLRPPTESMKQKASK